MKILIILLIGIQALELPNENCKPRSSIIHLGARNELFYPEAISLNRCAGLCRNETKYIIRCIASKENEIQLQVLNRISNKEEILVITNHTACDCNCVHEEKICYESQEWNNKTCQCTCDTKIDCPVDYLWNPGFCYCECDKICPKRMYLNTTSCSCNCKDKFYRRCSKRGLVVDETDCNCIQTSESSSPMKTNELSQLILPLFLLLLVVISIFKVIKNCRVE